MIDRAKIANERCSFCGKTKADGSGVLIMGPNACICSTCVKLCMDLLEDSEKLDEFSEEGNAGSET